MRVLIVSDHDPTSAKVRQIVLREGQDCSAGNVVKLEQAVDKAAQDHPDLIVLSLAGAPERAMKALADLRLLTTARLLAVGKAADPRVVLQAVRGGASDFIDEAELDSELCAALGRVRSEVTPQDELGHCIAVLGPSGGSGSSTLAVNVATLLAQQHKKALLLDLKLES